MIAKLLLLDAFSHGRHTACMQDAPRDAIAAATHADPSAWYARRRVEAPLAWDVPLQLWIAADAASVLDALAHPQLRVRPLSEPVPATLAGSPAGEVFGHLVRMNDGAFHARHKPAVQAHARSFDPDAVADAARAAAADLAPRAAPDALLSGIPVQAMARLLGVPTEQLDATTDWVTAFTQGIAPGAGADAIAAANVAAVQLVAQGAAQGFDPVRAANRIALMQQALDATAGLIGNTVLALRRDPTLGREDVHALVAEVARWDAQVQNTRRFAAQDIVLRGQSVRAGQGVLLLLACANRDDVLNPNGEAFVLDRPARRNLAFGSGVHACPGERIALAIAAAVLPAAEHALEGRRHAGYRPLANARIPVFQ
jgi:cytochrome P450